MCLLGERERERNRTLAQREIDRERSRETLRESRELFVLGAQPVCGCGPSVVTVVGLVVGICGAVCCGRKPFGARHDAQ